MQIHLELNIPDDEVKAVLTEVLNLVSGPVKIEAAEESKPAAKKTAAKKTAPAEEPASEDVEQDSADGEAKTIELARAKARELVGGGQAAKVREALESVGASKMSDLTAETAPEFLDALGS